MFWMIAVILLVLLVIRAAQSDPLASLYRFILLVLVLAAIHACMGCNGKP